MQESSMNHMGSGAVLEGEFRKHSMHGFMITHSYERMIPEEDFIAPIGCSGENNGVLNLQFDVSPKIPQK